ncbi:MAG: exopolysaccharide biosynthesis protein [Bacteroidales bacterium]|nr:exopolysaccharide biosynthesis protein [Bacteroidales bacterium]
MNTLLYILRLLFKRKWWLISLPTIAAIVVAMILSTKPDTYRSSTTIYTGIVSGYDIMSISSGSQDWLSINNAVDNLLSIIKAESTLENVSMRLLAQDLTHLDVENDNDFLLATTSQKLAESVPQDVMDLVVKGDEKKTFENFREYYSMDTGNYLYRLFHWNDRHYSYTALNSIEVNKVQSSDMLSMTYENDDPYIVYHTLLLLTDEFMNQYKLLRYEQTNDVIKYFEKELVRVGAELNTLEEGLKDFNIDNQIINYEEQTKMVAERTRDLDVRLETTNMNLQSARALRMTIEAKLDGMQTVANNAEFLKSLNTLGGLYSQVQNEKEAESVKTQIASETEKLQNITANLTSQKFTKEGLASMDLIQQWLDALLLETKSEAELDVLNKNYSDLTREYERFSPVGSSLKRQNRSINFSEQTYLAVLEALNEARLRQKNLQMTSATFKVMSPPSVAIGPEATKNTVLTILVFVCEFLFLFLLFVLMEILSRRPFDKANGERITGVEVLGAIPERNSKDKFADLVKNSAIQHVGNATINFFDRSKLTNIINVFSTDYGDGKTELGETLRDYFKSIDLKPAFFSWNKDFDITSKSFLMSWSIYDFAIPMDDSVNPAECDVIIVEYPPLSRVSIPNRLVTSAAINLLLVDSSRPWKGMDHILLRQLKLQTNMTPIRVVLSNADKDVIGAFTGMLPPYTAMHRFAFTVKNLGLSEQKTQE